MLLLSTRLGWYSLVRVPSRSLSCRRVCINVTVRIRQSSADVLFSPPAGLPTPFPKITVWPDGTPEYSSKDDSCETVTVTNHWVSCDGERTSCTTTSSATLSGCNAKSTAYTTGKSYGYREFPFHVLTSSMEQLQLAATFSLTTTTIMVPMVFRHLAQPLRRPRQHFRRSYRSLRRLPTPQLQRHGVLARRTTPSATRPRAA